MCAFQFMNCFTKLDPKKVKNESKSNISIISYKDTNISTIESRKRSLDSKIISGQEIDEKESPKVLFYQIFIPFLIAGFSNVAIGQILDRVQYWEVFKSIPELFLLMASFLGFKGNLEMTLAARLATQANTGQFDNNKDIRSITFGNIALIQSQSIIVGFLCSIIAIGVNYFKESKNENFHSDSCSLLIATAIVTASLSGFILTIVMVTVTVAARKFGLNPDNLSTLLTAILSDSTAGIMMVYAAKYFYEYRNICWLAPSIIVIFVPILICCFYYAMKNNFTKNVIFRGWIPIIIAMIISSIAGYIFDIAVERFDNIAIFLPVINGIGSNLIALQTSRISTYFHQNYEIGNMIGKWKNYFNPKDTFFGLNPNSRMALILIAMSLVAHAIYVVTLKICSGNIFITPAFMIVYFLASFIQVAILFYIGHVTIPFLWSKSIDPDTALIPVIMACGDFLGTAFLSLAYIALFYFNDPNAHIKR